jgi:ribosome-associated protein
VDQVLSGQRCPPLSLEGASTAQWVLMDFGDVVAHVFLSDVRDHYALEKLWADARRVSLTAPPPAAPGAPVRPARRRVARAREAR